MICDYSVRRRIFNKKYLYGAEEKFHAKEHFLICNGQRLCRSLFCKLVQIMHVCPYTL